MDKIVNWGTNSSIHGISHFVLSGNRSFKNRYFWLTVFTAFTTICLYLQVSLLYQIFVEKPTIVDVFHTRENYLNFPNVVVCDMNQKHDKVIEYFKAYGNGSRMTEFVVQMSKNNLYEVVRRQFRNDTSWASEIHPILTKQYAEAWAAMIPPWADIFKYKPTLGENLAQYNDPNFTNDAMEFVNFHDIVTSVTASYDEQVLFCQMDGENCLVEDSWKFIKSRNAVCLEFTPSRRKMFTPLQHLRIIFDFQVDQGLGYMDVGGGLHIQMYLYDPSETVLTTWDKSYSFDIGPGRSYRVGLSKRKYRDTSGFTNCIEEGKMNELKYYEKGYAHMLCVSECYTEAEHATCACITATQSFYPNDTRECGTVTMIMCPLDPASILAQCWSKCKPQCSFTKFDFDITSTKFPNPGFLKNRKAIQSAGTHSTEYGQKNYAELVINMASFSVKHTIVYPKYEIFSASSAIGGLFGMLLGGSALTMYELAELCTLWVSACFVGIVRKCANNNNIYP